MAYACLRAGWRGVGRLELSWCKDRPTLWMRPGNHSITGLPVSDRVTPSPSFVLSMQSFHVGSRSERCLTAGIHGV